MGAAKRVSVWCAAVVLCAITGLSCGGSASRDRNVASVAGSACPKPGQTSRISKANVVCAKTASGQVWYETVKARGKSVVCTSPGSLRKKKGVVWVCGVSKGSKSWRATAPLPVAVSQLAGAAASQLQSTDEGSSSSPVVADNEVLANPAIPDESIPPMSSIVQSTVPSSWSTNMKLTTTSGTVSPETSTSVTVVPTTELSTSTSQTTTTVDPLPTSFTNRDMYAGLGSNAVRRVFVSGATVYAATAGGLSISADGGMSFENHEMTDPLSPVSLNYVRELFVSGSSVYAAVPRGVAISTDGGQSFTTYATGGNQGYEIGHGLYVSGSKVFVGTAKAGLAISNDGGVTFTKRTTADGLGDDWVTSLCVLGSVIYAATFKGLSISTDGGNTFTNRSIESGLGAEMIYQVIASGPSVYGATVYAATNNGLSISTNGGMTFTNHTTADGLGSNVVLGVFASGSTVYAATRGGLSISTDGGATFRNYTTADGLGSNFVWGVYASGSKVYAATNGGLSISN